MFVGGVAALVVVISYLLRLRMGLGGFTHGRGGWCPELGGHERVGS